ncbi:MAG: hypothetical protein KIT38_13805 [Gemmatimonadaceae bacterium]|nr:hypothetical protein [Gemmatimonadaceae bacterium]
MFDAFRTADFSQPLRESQGCARFQAGQQRAPFLVEVGSVLMSSGGSPQLDAPTAPAAHADTLGVPSGNAGSYSILSTVTISCTATRCVRSARTGRGPSSTTSRRSAASI